MGRLLLLFIALPAVELALLIEIGQRIGTLANKPAHVRHNGAHAIQTFQRFIDQRRQVRHQVRDPGTLLTGN